MKIRAPDLREKETLTSTKDGGSDGRRSRDLTIFSDNRAPMEASKQAGVPRNFADFRIKLARRDQGDSAHSWAKCGQDPRPLYTPLV